MSWTNRFKNSWLLFRNSISVLFSNPKLFIFPVLIFVAMIGTIVLFIAPIALQPTGRSYTQAAHWNAVIFSFFKLPITNGVQSQHAAVSDIIRVHFTAYMALLYLVSMFLATFFSVAFSNEIFTALANRPVSIIRGLLFACSKLKAIFLWSLFAGLVGLGIRKLEERLGFVANIVLSLIGIAWSVATVFAIPVMINDAQAINPIETLRKSASTLKKTWGESLIGYVGIELGGILVVIVSFAFIVGFSMLSIWLNRPWMMPLAFVVWVVCLFGFLYVSHIAERIYQCALYVYASRGIVPQPYDRGMMDQAWKTR
jgi:hypothetical protein